MVESFEIWSAGSSFLRKSAEVQVSANGKGFIRGLGWWFALALPSTYTNAMVSLSLPNLRR